MAKSLQEMLAAVANGTMSPTEAEAWLLRHQVAEMDYATLDLQRTLRRGKPEVILAEQKTAEQVYAIADRFLEAGQDVMVTRLTKEQLDHFPEELQGVKVELFPKARLARVFREMPPQKVGIVGVLAAGTSDLPVAEEAALVAESFGSPVRRAYDVGVAGLHRLFRHADLLLEARVLIVVAGMEGALPSVVSGLTSAPVIAVPVSVGYGASFGGFSALLTMINSCSPGISVVNIDNGFGAGYLADSINGIGERPRQD